MDQNTKKEIIKLMEQLDEPAQNVVIQILQCLLAAGQNRD